LIRAQIPSPKSVPLGTTTAARPDLGGRLSLRMMSWRKSKAVSEVCLSWRRRARHPVESFKHLEKQCKTVEDREILQKHSIFGGEAKSLPYLLAQMNLVLHGLESPKIDPLNSLRFPLREIGDRDRVDIIMTNPPFGGLGKVAEA
jgi:hypothetical protein